MKVFAVAVTFIAGFTSGTILPASRSLNRPPPLADRAVASFGNGNFDQLIDHEDPGLGTFSQRFWWSDEFWAGPGSPVVFFTPGESAADGYGSYLTNKTITGLFAEAIGGAVVMLEHRYWGESSPFEELTTKNLQYLTLAQSIADTTYFAKNVVFPFDTNGSSQATRAPWIFSGGSYSGALSAWTQALDPGTFWAYHASSAVVETIYDFWQYFAPVQEGMPKNCSADVSLVIEYVDDVLLHGSAAEKQALKEKFGLGGVEHDDDFAGALENGPWLWQSNTFYSDYSGFYQFCDYIENVAGNNGTNITHIPDATGVGLYKALNGYAKWMKTIEIPGFCSSYGYWSDPYDLSCFDTYNESSPIFTDITLNNSIDRQWNWFLCNEPFAYWQDGAPKDRPTIVSRLVNAEYWQRQCDLFFPPEGKYTYGSARGKTVEDVNAYTGGWFANTTRLIWTNGQFDPWRDATVSSEFRPGGPLESTEAAPVQVIPSGIHCSDLHARNGEVNEGVQQVIDNEIAQIKTWVDEYYAGKR